MFKRFTAAARDVVVAARHEAQQLHHAQIGSEHLLLALLSDTTGLPYQVLHPAGLDSDRVRADIVRLATTPSTPLGEEDAAALRTIGIDLDAVLATVEESFGPDALHPSAPAPRRESVWGGWGGVSRFTPRAKKIMELSLRESLRLGHNYLGVEHILLAILRDGQGQGARILTDAGLSVDDLYATVVATVKQAA